MAYTVIHTAVGLQLLAQAEATGTPINLTHVAVGDGNGNPVTPDEGQTELARERFRTTINTVYQNPDNPAMYIVEAIIPASTGGFVMREVGVFDANGNLFVVGNLPDTTKPTDSEGAYSDTTITIPFMVTNAAEVTLIVDPNVVTATRQWVLNTITVCHLLPGGTTGQVLKKKSNACGDVEWGDPDVADVVVDVIEERQTLAASQTTVTWAVVTTRGLAVYIEGVRIPKGSGADEWQIDAADPDASIILGKSYPAGTRILGTQNEPTGSVPFPLERDKNLADVPDKAQGRINLDVFSKSETRQMAPPGLVGHFARNSAPTGWLKANGAAVSRTAYADLFAAIGTTFGPGDGFNTFNLPDLRGEFVRGWDDGRGVDTGRALGSNQGAAAPNITGRVLGSVEEASASATGAFQIDKTSTIGAPTGQSSWGFNFDASRSSSMYQSVNEVRPRNMALLACIKF